jgi:hypothetical protein
MLSDEEIEALRNWLVTQRTTKVANISPGLFWWVLDVASGCATLPAAKAEADKILNELNAQAREIPLVVQELDHSFRAQRLVQGYIDEKKSSAGALKLMEHLAKAIAVIEAQSHLVRKVSAQEAAVYLDRTKAGSPEAVFPDGTEGGKAFAISRVYSFSKGTRNKQVGAYDYHLRIQLTRSLQDYLVKHLWANVRRVTVKEVGQSSRTERLGLDYNPQIKYENSQYTLYIPPTAWRAFWQRVEVFEIVRSDGTMFKSSAEIAKDQHLAAHKDQLRAFNMATHKGAAEPSLPPGAMPYIS